MPSGPSWLSIRVALRALADADQRAREQRDRLVRRGDEDEMQRPRDRGTVGNPDHRAVAHHRGVERERRVVLQRRDAAETLQHRGIALRQGLGQRADGKTRLKRGKIGQIGANTPSTITIRRAFTAARKAPADFAVELRRRIRRRRQRLGIAHQRAQVGIFPFLDAPVRQALAPRRRGRRSRAAT